ncbi:hypothetical protein [Methylovirgula sp. 4M-Z18]|uniref:hypothetical protein n=1 Tax=Methylovirgula sp. 4M-Z18 TaxID=2293567 RepID=UPI000E2E65CF|nr:hypothetical protein [Methylovirgula sp. 4M-Z18]RFB80008.1 hypothetical protein DYH55_00195 [Methylovirgula sp. 4M-Z18]
MAELTDVYNALVSLIGGALWPQGLSGVSAIGAPCKIYPRSPASTELDADLRAGIVHVSIFAPPNREKVTTRYPRVWQDQFPGAPTITVAVSGSTVTLGGTVTPTHYVSIVVAAQGFSYACTASDTLSSVAQALAQQMPAGLGASVSGAAITIGGRGDIVARCAAPGTMMMEVRRQNRGLTIAIHAPSPQLRDAAAALIDPLLATTDFLSLPDATAAWITYQGTDEADEGQKAMDYRRDIHIWAEYPTIIIAPAYPITIVQNQLALADGSASGTTLIENG